MNNKLIKTKGQLKGKIIKIRRGLAIYQTNASPYYYVRIYTGKIQKYLVRTTKVKSRIEAREVAEELFLSLTGKVKVSNNFDFKSYALRFLEKAKVEVSQGKKNLQYLRIASGVINNEDYGLLKFFSGKDVRELHTKQYQEYIDFIYKKRPNLSAATINKSIGFYRNCLKIARDDGVIDRLPQTPRQTEYDNPRPFFRFAPLVDDDANQYKILLTTTKRLIEEKVKVRGLYITDEIYDLILFVVHSFVRPTLTELYSIKHADVAVATKPKRLILTIRNGKTGHRICNTLETAVAILERIKRRHPNSCAPDNYLFSPDLLNRVTVSKNFTRQFNEILKQGNIKLDPFTNTNHTLYSLRHTALSMRLVLSGGKVNIYNLAKNAGTSVEQIERFYAKYLPLSAELARNLQSFSDERD